MEMPSMWKVARLLDRGLDRGLYTALDRGLDKAHLGDAVHVEGGGQEGLGHIQRAGNHQHGGDDQLQAQGQLDAGLRGDCAWGTQGQGGTGGW